tara:strand:- start:312 stop:605 length:294 start_codon:yes stop_codon:yes gene_type:complete
LNDQAVVGTLEEAVVETYLVIVKIRKILRCKDISMLDYKAHAITIQRRIISIILVLSDNTDPTDQTVQTVLFFKQMLAVISLFTILFVGLWLEAVLQ